MIMSADKEGVIYIYNLEVNSCNPSELEIR